MTLYFKTDPGGDSIFGAQSRAEPPIDVNDRRAGQIREGPLDAYGRTDATRGHTVRAKPTRT